MTRDRVANLLIAAVLVAGAIWVATHTYWDDVSVTTPLKGEAAQNPYYSLEHLVRTLGIRTAEIASLHRLPEGAVVLVNDLRDNLLNERPEQRIESLKSWVESGGRLIVTGDTLRSSSALQRWSGIVPTHRDARAATAVHAPVRTGSDPDGNCTSMTVHIDGPADEGSLLVCAAASETAFTSRLPPAWALSDSRGLRALRVGIGRGEFIVIHSRWILSNKGLPVHDHAWLLVEAARLGRGEELLILRALQPEPLPTLLWRVAPLAILFLAAALLLLILRNLPRFGPPEPVPAPVRRSLAEQIRANARFAWRTRKLGPLRAAVRRSLDEAARRRIVGYGSFNERQRAGALAARTGVEPGTMIAALTEDAGGNANLQRAAIARLETARRILERPPQRR